MIKYIELTAIDTEKENSWMASQRQSTIGRELEIDEANADDGDEELDDLEQPMRAPVVSDAATQAAPTPTPGLVPAGVYFPVTIFLAEVREFYPRKGNRNGTRIVSPNGAARLVKETYAEVSAAVKTALAS
jgi:hypothetical protein